MSHKFLVSVPSICSLNIKPMIAIGSEPMMISQPRRESSDKLKRRLTIEPSAARVSPACPRRLSNPK